MRHPEETEKLTGLWEAGRVTMLAAVEPGAARTLGCLLQVESLKHLTARFPGTQSAFLSAATMLAGGRQPEPPPHSGAAQPTAAQQAGPALTTTAGCRLEMRIDGRDGAVAKHKA